MRWRRTCSTCGYCKSGASLTEDPCKTCEVITVNEFTNWHPIPITNADRIRNMTIEGLAEELSKVETDGRAYGPLGKQHWLEWLGKEVQDG